MILGIVFASLIKLRKMNTSDTAFFKLRYGNTLAILGILICITLLMSSKANEFRDTLITLTIGVLIFMIYNYFKKAKN